MPTTAEDIAGYVKRYGWPIEVRDSDIAVTGFRGRQSVFRVFVQIADPWVLLVVVPFVPAPAPNCRQRFYEYALRLNFAMNLCKLGIDDDGDFALSLELPVRDLRYEDLGAALDALAYYADTYHDPLLSLGRDTAYQPPDPGA